MNFHEEFYEEFQELSLEVKEGISIKIELLIKFGTQLNRPHVNTLKGSVFPNMKELRVSTGNEVWRIAFAFDPVREAILLVGGDKRGKNQKLFYKKLIKIADKRFQDHLDKLTKE